MSDTHAERTAALVAALMLAAAVLPGCGSARETEPGGADGGAAGADGSTRDTSDEPGESTPVEGVPVDDRPVFESGPYDNLTRGQIRTLVREAVLAGDWQAALPLAQELATRRPDLAEFQELLGYVQSNAGRHALAAESYAVALELDPGNHEYIEGRARALAGAGEVRAALDFLGDAANETADPDLYHRLGTLALGVGLIEEAETAFRSALAASGGEQVRTQRALAELYRSLGDDEREMRHLRVLLTLTPEDETIPARIRELGEIPGPSLALPPSLVDGTNATY